MQQPHEPNITEYKRGNFTVRIRPTIKDGKQYFIADFTILGKRRLVWRSSLAKARQAASEAVDAMDAGQAEVLLLTAADRHAYLRACEALRSIEAIEAIDTACGHYAEAMAVLGGKTSILDACRDWIKRNDVAVPKKSVGEAADDCLASARSDGKKKDRVRKLETVFNRFKTDLSIPVSQVTPALVSQWLAGLELSERTRKNYRDAIGYLTRVARRTHDVRLQDPPQLPGLPRRQLHRPRRLRQVCPGRSGKTGWKATAPMTTKNCAICNRRFTCMSPTRKCCSMPCCLQYSKSHPESQRQSRSTYTPRPECGWGSDGMAARHGIRNRAS